MQITDQVLWDSLREANPGVDEKAPGTGDNYGKTILDFAEQWANLMEEKIFQGHQVKDVAQECNDIVLNNPDQDMNITGFMYGTVVKVLAQTWKYGESLRQWHNGEYGVGPDVKGTVNPAILTIST